MIAIHEDTDNVNKQPEVVKNSDARFVNLISKLKVRYYELIQLVIF